jgi:hypothetical protein
MFPANCVQQVLLELVVFYALILAIKLILLATSILCFIFSWKHYYAKKYTFSALVWMIGCSLLPCASDEVLGPCFRYFAWGFEQISSG